MGLKQYNIQALSNPADTEETPASNNGSTPTTDPGTKAGGTNSPGLDTGIKVGRTEGGGCHGEQVVQGAEKLLSPVDEKEVPSTSEERVERRTEDCEQVNGSVPD